MHIDIKEKFYTFHTLWICRLMQILLLGISKYQQKPWLTRITKII